MVDGWRFFRVADFFPAPPRQIARAAPQVSLEGQADPEIEIVSYLFPRHPRSKARVERIACIEIGARNFANPPGPGAVILSLVDSVSFLSGSSPRSLPQQGLIRSSGLRTPVAPMSFAT